MDCYPQQGDIALQKIEDCIHAAKLYGCFWIKISYFSSINYAEIGFGVTTPEAGRHLR